MSTMQKTTLKKSDLISNVAYSCQNIEEKLVDEAVREILNLMGDVLHKDGRIEVRGFGSFCLHHREARKARNPKTGEVVSVREMVNYPTI